MVFLPETNKDTTYCDNHDQRVLARRNEGTLQDYFWFAASYRKDQYCLYFFPESQTFQLYANQGLREVVSFTFLPDITPENASEKLSTILTFL